MSKKRKKTEIIVNYFGKRVNQKQEKTTYLYI